MSDAHPLTPRSEALLASLNVDAPVAEQKDDRRRRPPTLTRQSKANIYFTLADTTIGNGERNSNDKTIFSSLIDDLLYVSGIFDLLFFSFLVSRALSQKFSQLNQTAAPSNDAAVVNAATSSSTTATSTAATASSTTTTSVTVTSSASSSSSISAASPSSHSHSILTTGMPLPHTADGTSNHYSTLPLPSPSAYVSNRRSSMFATAGAPSVASTAMRTTKGAAAAASMQKKRKNTIIVTSQNNIFDEFQQVQQSHLTSQQAAAAAAAAANVDRRGHTRHRSSREPQSNSFSTNNPNAVYSSTASSPNASSSTTASALSTPLPPNSNDSSLTATGAAAVANLFPTRRSGGSNKSSRRSSDDAKNPALPPTGRRTSGGTTVLDSPARGGSRRTSGGTVSTNGGGKSQTQLIQEALERYSKEKASASPSPVGFDQTSPIVSRAQSHAASPQHRPLNNNNKPAAASSNNVPKHPGELPSPVTFTHRPLSSPSASPFSSTPTLNPSTSPPMGRCISADSNLLMSASDPQFNFGVEGPVPLDRAYTFSPVSRQSSLYSNGSGEFNQPEILEETAQFASPTRISNGDVLPPPLSATRDSPSATGNNNGHGHAVASSSSMSFSQVSSPSKEGGDGSLTADDVNQFLAQAALAPMRTAEVPSPSAVSSSSPTTTTSSTALPSPSQPQRQMYELSSNSILPSPSSLSPVHLPVSASPVAASTNSPAIELARLESPGSSDTTISIGSNSPISPPMRIFVQPPSAAAASAAANVTSASPAAPPAERDQDIVADEVAFSGDEDEGADDDAVDYENQSNLYEGASDSEALPDEGDEDHEGTDLLHRSDMLDPSQQVLSSEESLAELELVKMNRWSLRFENTKMEQIFEKHFTSKLSENFLFLNLLVIGQHLFLGIVEYFTDTTSDIVFPIFLCRIIIIAIFLMSALFTYGQKRKDEAIIKRIEQLQQLAEEEEEEEQQLVGEQEFEAQNHQMMDVAEMNEEEQQAASLNHVMVDSPPLKITSIRIENVDAKPGDEMKPDIAVAHEVPPPATTAVPLSPDHQSVPRASLSPSSNLSSDSEVSADDTTSASSSQEVLEPPQPRLYLLKLIVLLNFLQGAMMLIAFTLASKRNGEMDVFGTRPSEFSLYSPSAGELSTAFSLVLYGFVFVGSGMLLVYALPLSILYFIASLIISATLESPPGRFISSIVLQSIFLCLCASNMYSMEKQTRKELILLCTVARDRARGNDLINNMLPPSMVLRLQMMQANYEAEMAEQEAKQRLLDEGGAPVEEQEIEVEDSQGNMVLRKVPVPSPAAISLSADNLLLHSTHFYDVYDNVTVLFCYLSSFADLVVFMAPQSLVKLLNDIYSAFDDSILTFEGMYKVEAIAETYMAVSGCPFMNNRHAQTVAEFALNMQEIIARNYEAYEHTLAQQMQEQLDAVNNAMSSGMPKLLRAGSNQSTRSPPSARRARSVNNPQSASPPNPAFSFKTRPAKVSIQIGVHSGPIAAGVIGTKTLSYHLFGDAVNTASRMCSTGAPGRIQCSETTAALVHEEYALESLGVRQVKGKGQMKTYFLNGRQTRPIYKGKFAAAAAAAQDRPGVPALDKVADSTGASRRDLHQESGRHLLQSHASQSQLSHPLPSSPRHLLQESAKEEAARHAVDSFQSIVALHENHQSTHSLHHRNFSMSPTASNATAASLNTLHNRSSSAAGPLTLNTKLSNKDLLSIAVPVNESPKLSPAAPTTHAADALSPLNASGSFQFSPTNAASSPPVTLSSGAPLAARSSRSVAGSPSGSVGAASGGGGTNSLQFVAEFPASTISLRLSDPVLEAEFHAVYLQKSRQHLKIMLPMLLILFSVYTIAGAITTASENLKYFLPQSAIILASLGSLGWILSHSAQQDQATAAAAAEANQSHAASQATGTASPASDRGSVSMPPPLSIFHRFDQLFIGTVVTVVMICMNMTGFYSRSHSTSDFDSLEDGSLISNFETLVNFNILAIMVIFFAMRLYYRTSCVVAAIVLVDLAIVFAASDSGSRSSIMSLSVVLVCTLLSAYAQYHREYTMRFDFLLERVLMHEKNNLFQLLQNMLPSPRHAHKLMTGEQVIELQECVTLLYSDIRGFTEMSTKMAPQDLCTLLNSFYSAFDEHLDVRGVYKIDTIGDAFVVVGGLAIENSTVEHASAIADFALDMLGEIENVKKMWLQIPEANPLIQGVTMRIGIHTGTVIAATVGLIRPKYLLFGRDTLVANKMESEGIPGQVQVSQTTFDQLSPGHTHLMEPRGIVDMGEKLGKMQTYLLKGRYLDILRAARDRFAHAATKKDEEEALLLAQEEEAGLEAVEDENPLLAQGFSADHSASVLPAVPSDAVPPVPVTDRDAAIMRGWNPRSPLKRLVSSPGIIPAAPSGMPPPLHSADDSTITGPPSRSAVKLARQIAHVRALSREVMFRSSPAIDAFEAPSTQAPPAPSRFTLNKRSGSMVNVHTGIQANRAALVMPNRGIDTVSMPVTPRGSVLDSTFLSFPIGSYSVGVSGNNTPGPMEGSGDNTPTPHGLPRTPHRRSFTFHNLNTKALAPQSSNSSSNATGKNSPFTTGLPPMGPSSSFNANLVSPTALQKRASISERERPQLTSSEPNAPVERSRSRSLTPLASSGTLFADSGLHDLAKDHSNDSPALTDNESTTPQPNPAQQSYSTRDLFQGHVHRRQGSISNTPAVAFSRGIALHHRRSTSVIFSNHNQPAPSGVSTAVGTPRNGSGQNSSATSAVPSRVGSFISLTGNSLLWNEKESFKTRPPLPAPAASPSPHPTSGATSPSPMKKQQSDLSLVRPASAAAASRPAPARRIRSMAADAPNMVVEEESPSSPQSGSMQSKQLTSHDSSTQLLPSATSGKSKRGHVRSSSLASWQSAAATSSSAHDSGSTTPKKLLPVAASIARSQTTAAPLSIRQHSLRALQSMPAAKRRPSMPSFDDSHVLIEALRSQHERDLDGAASLGAQAKKAKQELQAFASKLQLLASKRAVMPSLPTVEASPVVRPMTLTSPPAGVPPVTIFLNDEQVPSSSSTTTSSLQQSVAIFSLSGTPSPYPEAGTLQTPQLWSNLLSPVAGSPASQHAELISPAARMVELVDENLAKEREEAAKLKAMPTEEKAGLDAGAPTSLELQSSGSKAATHSRSASRMLDHLDSLHAFASPTPPSKEKEEVEPVSVPLPALQEIPHVSIAPTEKRVSLSISHSKDSGTSSNTHSNSIKVRRISSTSTLDKPSPKSSAKLALNTDSPSSRRALSGLRFHASPSMEPLARDQVEADILSGALQSLPINVLRPPNSRENSHSGMGPVFHRSANASPYPAISKRRESRSKSFQHHSGSPSHSPQYHGSRSHSIVQSQSADWHLALPPSSSDQLPSTTPLGVFIPEGTMAVPTPRWSITYGPSSIQAPASARGHMHSRSTSMNIGAPVFHASSPNSRRHSFSGVNPPIALHSTNLTPQTSVSSGSSLADMKRDSLSQTHLHHSAPHHSHSHHLAPRRFNSTVVSSGSSSLAPPLRRGGGLSNEGVSTLAASTVHASPIPNPRPPALLLNQFHALARAASAIDSSSSGHLAQNLKPSALRTTGSPLAIAASGVGVLPLKRGVSSTGPTTAAPVSPLVARLHSSLHPHGSSGAAASTHMARTPSFGGFEIRFRGANQNSGGAANAGSSVNRGSLSVTVPVGGHAAGGLSGHSPNPAGRLSVSGKPVQKKKKDGE